ncbi:MAG: xanthine dehydrogenase small subunit [Marinosulfonomonas sp.]|nr:xanthine dehydrogenase small subunit [Marinosulfonomonas sp.]
MKVQFLLNGETVHVEGQPATRTLLDWLREDRGLNGTKEGCNEGDCGACTVMVTDERGTRTVNACILFLPQIHGKAIRTVEGISGPKGQPHPVQTHMIQKHASQCGFCTPGFVVSMAVAHKNGRTDFDDQMAGNLCRCTGYAPIIRAAEAAANDPVPDWMNDEPSDIKVSGDTGDQVFLPDTSDEFADWYVNNPDATIVAGATDVGLWVTKRLDTLDSLAFIGGIPDLQETHVSDDAITFGAAVTVARFGDLVAQHHPSFGELIRRYGSTQVRNSATIGGNIANGSPIGDSPPALIALNAKLHLRRGDARRVIALEDFYIEYGKQDREPGEFVQAIEIPRQPDRLKCYKLTKRFDQDISAVCGCFVISTENGVVADTRIAFGGMAGTPKRATHVEDALRGQNWSRKTVEDACALFNNDFSPLSDMRASAEYRLQTAQNMLIRYVLEDQGVATQVLEVSA